MCNSLKIGIYGENNQFFGEVEENVQSLFFNLDLSYDVVYLDNELRITNPLDILFVNMGKIMNKASSKFENMLRSVGSYIVAIAENAEELLYAFRIKANTAMLRNNAKKNVVTALDEVLHDMLQKDKIVIEDNLEKHIIDVADTSLNSLTYNPYIFLFALSNSLSCIPSFLYFSIFSSIICLTFSTSSVFP